VTLPPLHDGRSPPLHGAMAARASRWRAVGRIKQAADPPLPRPAAPSLDLAASPLPRLTASMAGACGHATSSAAPIHLARLGRGSRGGMRLRPHPPRAVGTKGRPAPPQLPTSYIMAVRRCCVSNVSERFFRHVAGPYFKCFSSFICMF